eukprot:TRINITY_DN1922_c0_g1_i1.p2 TRINITY_DN1922_c0_g1~~TRINITY_DN1922_c0_g1_i1.p2  ORF type:complete len:155 (-),score=58.40 TRINITY_DN1922_c0_g1_i1:166-630(-)
MSFFDLKAKDIKGHEVDFSKFKGKVTLIVNVASKCGYTAGNYDELPQLYSKFKDQGLEILAFPCNQFGKQEPGTNQEIESFCSARKVTFPVMDKVDVNGPNTSPVFTFLKSKLPGDIKWNFEKFLVDKTGTPVKRYGSGANPNSIAKDIEPLLA